MIYDLHVHSTKSDGKYDRFKLIKYFIDNNFEYACFADHNYISDLNIYNSFIEKYNGSKLKLINGIEFDVENFKNMHVLGYGIKDIKKVKRIDVIKLIYELSKKVG